MNSFYAGISCAVLSGIAFDFNRPGTSAGLVCAALLLILAGPFVESLFGKDDK